MSYADTFDAGMGHRVWGHDCKAYLYPCHHSVDGIGQLAIYLPPDYTRHVCGSQRNVVVEWGSGIMDKRNRQIYTGDIVRYRVPYRSYEDHYGENIPGPTNTYRQTLEPLIRTEMRAVTFRNGAFCWEDCRNDGFDFPISLDDRSYTSRADLMEAFECRRGEADWLGEGDDERGDLDWLLHEYGLADEAALMAHLSGLEVIGNIHEHADLLVKTPLPS